MTARPAFGGPDGGMGGVTGFGIGPGDGLPDGTLGAG
jgi:hypothetical protein